MSDIKYYMSELGTNNRHVAYRYSVLVEQCEQLRQQIAEKDKRIESLEAYLLNIRNPALPVDHSLPLLMGYEAGRKDVKEVDITEGMFIRVEGELHRVIDISETSVIGAYRIMTEKVD